MLENNLPKFKAVVLDGYTLNSGDLSWSALESICDLTIYDKTDADQVIDRVKDCEIAFTNKVQFSKDVIQQLPKLKYIGVMATGFNVIDLDATRNAGIVVTNIPSYSSLSVAQLVLAFMFQFMWHVKEHSDEVHSGKWSNSEHFCYKSFDVHELTGHTLGIVGFGNIGQEVAKVGLALGMNVIYFNRSQKSVKGLEQAKQVSSDELFSNSDFVSLNCPLTDDNNGFIDLSVLNKMKKTAYIINTARGPLVNEEDMARALKENIIAGYGADVLSVEPPKKNNPLFNCPNCLITPHIAWQTVEARNRLVKILINNLQSFLEGNVINKVN